MAPEFDKVKVARYIDYVRSTEPRQCIDNALVRGKRRRRECRLVKRHHAQVPIARGTAVRLLALQLKAWDIAAVGV